MAVPLWNEDLQRYEDERGRPVDEAAVLAAAALFTEAMQVQFRDNAQELLDGDQDLPTWQQRHAGLIKAGNLVMTMIGGGGVEVLKSMSPISAVSGIIDQLRFAANFAKQLESGRQPLNGTVRSRSALYGGAMRKSFHEQRRLNHIGKVAVQERRVLGNAEHCPGCIEQAARGWQPQGTLPEIGSQQCRQNCHCKFVFRRKPGTVNPCARGPAVIEELKVAV